MVVNNNNELVAVISERDYLKATNSNQELPTANEQRFSDAKQASPSNSLKKARRDTAIELFR